MRTRFACVLFLAALQPVRAHAQVSMTEQQAVDRLSAESPQARAARAPVEAARADVLAAARWPNPRANVTREAAGGFSEQYLTASQVLPMTGRRGLDVASASARVEGATRRADERIARLRADARLAFTDLWLAQQREAELRRGRSRLQELADVLQRRESAGEAAGFDHLRAERDVMDADLESAEAGSVRSQAETVLNGYFAAPAGPITAVVPAPSRDDVPAVEALVATARTRRPALLALTRELDAARLAEQAAGRRAIPEPEVVGGTKSSDAGTGSIGSILGVHVTIPLFDRAGPERALARARSAELQAEIDLFLHQLRTQIAVWRGLVVDRRAAADRYRASAGANAEAIVRIAQVSYDAGERGILELLDAFRLDSSARLRQASLDASAREAEIELEFLTGWESR